MEDVRRAYVSGSWGLIGVKQSAMDTITANPLVQSPVERASVADGGMAGQIHRVPDLDLLIYLLEESIFRRKRWIHI